MGTVFEELVRRFNEENNEEAGEHWTPRDAVQAHGEADLPADRRPDRVRHLPALRRRLRHRRHADRGRGDACRELAEERGKQVATHLYGQEINSETYAIAKADLLLKGEGEAADNIVGGPEYSTLSNDAFPSREFDFMLSNPPYGKSWKSDLERMGGKDGIKDPRFVIEHAGDPEYSLLTRSSDGQMLFLANMLSKMKQDTRLGSRIAEVHNGISLFTGDAGQGESNIRRWIIENDWLEAIVALPLNMFYNTGIATYIWVLTNRKPEHRTRQGAAHRRDEVVQAAAQEPRQEELRAIGRGHRADLRHLPRLRGDRAVEDLPERRLRLLEGHGRATPAAQGDRPRTAPTAPKEIKALKETRRARRGRASPSSGRSTGRARSIPIRSTACSRRTIDGRRCVVEYEPDTDLRDTEQVPLLEEGGIEAFIRREVLPYAADAWYRPGKRQDRLRDQLHPVLLQAAAAAHPRGDPRRHPGTRSGDRRAARARSSVVISRDRRPQAAIRR